MGRRLLASARLEPLPNLPFARPGGTSGSLHPLLGTGAAPPLIVCVTFLSRISGFAGTEPLQRRYRPLQSCYESLRSRYESLPSRYESLRGGMAPRSLCLTTAFAPAPRFLGGLWGWGKIPPGRLAPGPAWWLPLEPPVMLPEGPCRRGFTVDPQCSCMRQAPRKRSGPAAHFMGIL